MASFELDVAFAPEDAANGLERLFARRDRPWSRRAGGDRRYEFVTELAGGTQVVVNVAPLPLERRTYASFFPRTLVQAHASDAAGLETLRRDIILTFLRVMG